MTEDIKQCHSNLQVRNPELIGVTLKDIVNEIALGISLSDFQKIVTTLKKPSIVKSLYNMQKMDIINDSNQIINKMYKETEVDVKYNEITKLISDCQEDISSIAWRPVTGDCNIQLSAYRKKSLMEKKRKLEHLIQEKRNSRLLLKKSLDMKRSHLESLMKEIKLATLKLDRTYKLYVE